MTQIIRTIPAVFDASGNLKVNVAAGGASGGTSSSFGAALPGTGTAAGASDGSGNMQALQVDGSGNLKIAGSFSSSPITAATSALTNVADNASNVTVLAANALRLSFRIYNDSTAILYLKCGATASTTSFTQKVLPSQAWGTTDLGVNYNGKIDGIWASAPGGAARVTELTA